MKDLQAAEFLKDLAEQLASDQACTPDDPLMLHSKKDRRQICRQLELLGQRFYRQDERFARLYLLANKFDASRKEFASHRFSRPERVQWSKELLDLVDTLEGLPERFTTLRHPDHPQEVILQDQISGRKVYLTSELRTVLPVLTQLFEGRST